jgi:hypothetical protein
LSSMAMSMGWDQRVRHTVGNGNNDTIHVGRNDNKPTPSAASSASTEKIQSTTDAGSLNTFGRNEIEVALISSALLRIACLVILYKTKFAVFRTKNSHPMGVSESV